ncbi:MAG: D-aminoacyl-tRNA deacylase [bacterium]
MGCGCVVFVGIAAEDREEDELHMLEKILALRIFDDGHGRMNLSLRDVRGGLMLIPQFTLLADTSKGRRPSFFHAARPEEARTHFDALAQKAKKALGDVQTGTFGAQMTVNVENDGPVTILLDTKA